MVDDAIEDGLSPGGCSAKLLKNHRRHSSALKIKPISLAICPAFGLFFSEKLLGHSEVRVDCVNLHVQPELGALRFDNVHVSLVDGTHAARRRLSILLKLVWDEHGLLCGGCESCLPGKLGYQISDAIMSASVQPFGAAGGVSPIGVKDMLTLFAFRGVLPHC